MCLTQPMGDLTPGGGGKLLSVLGARGPLGGVKPCQDDPKTWDTTGIHGTQRRSVLPEAREEIETQGKEGLDWVPLLCTVGMWVN